MTTANEDHWAKRQEELATRQVYMGFTYPELREAFDRVSDADDWKAPIVDAKVDGDDLAVTIAAIGFFTATNASVEPVIGGDFIVNSIGYRAGPAGP